jgi:Spy/CpxP family protein refolding chaperone
MKTYITTGLAGLILALAFLPALSQAKPKGDRGMLNPKRIEKIADKLGVSEETAKQMKSLVYESKRKGIPLKAKGEAARLDLRELMDSDAPDEAQVMAKIEAIGQIQIEARKLRIGTMLKVRALLTPEQRKTLRKMMARRMGKKGRRGHRGKWGKRGQERQPGFQRDK